MTCSLARVHVPDQPNSDEHQMQLTPEVPHKVCTKCGEDKPLEDFYVWKNTKDGRFPSCKECKKQQERDRRKANPEHIRALATASREGRRDRVRQQDREWRARNIEKLRAQDRAEYELQKQDPVRMARRRDYARTRAMRAKYGLNELAEEYGAILMGDPCSYCGAPAEHVDHIVPHAKNGEHEWDNLTAACASCNFRKGKGSLLGVLLKGLA